MAQPTGVSDEELKACEDIASRLQSDRLICIIVGQGDDPKSCYIQQTLLESVSEYFINALKHENLGPTGASGILRFPDDDVETWKLLLYWLIRREFSCNMVNNPELSVGCYSLGDCYRITKFQDEAMLSLLMYMDTRYLDRATVTKVFKGSPPGSELRRAIFEDLVWPSFRVGAGQRFKFSDIDNTLNGLNFAEDLLGVQDRLAKLDLQGRRKRSPRHRFGYAPLGIMPSWQEYVAGKESAGFFESVAQYLAVEDGDSEGSD